MSKAQISLVLICLYLILSAGSAASNKFQTEKNASGEKTIVPAFYPIYIGDPAWTSFGVQKDTIVTLTNNGDEALNIISITPYSDYPGAIAADQSGPLSVPAGGQFDLTVNLNWGGTVAGVTPTRVTGYIEFAWDADAGSIYQYPITFMVADTIQFPDRRDIRTECTRIVFDNAGGIGLGFYGGYNLNLFDDCDTTNNDNGFDDNASTYLYDASPFVSYIEGDDTLFFDNIYNSSFTDPDGFRPLEGVMADSNSFGDYQYGYTGKYLTADSTISIETWYFAPKDLDSCEFIVVKRKFYNNTASTINGLWVGSIYDWDAPSDWSIKNSSGYDAIGGDASRDLFYFSGAELEVDPIPNNDCVLADQRLGGMAFYNGYGIPFCAPATPSDSLQNPIGPWWSHMQTNWHDGTGNLYGSAIYKKLEYMGSGFEAWEAQTQDYPDSVYQDLFMVGAYGKFDLRQFDTLVFVDIISSTYNGLAGLQENIDQARAWISGRPDIFEWPEGGSGCDGCCEVPGDVNGNGSVNIIDITCLITRLYDDPVNWCDNDCLSEIDANGNNAINILDVTYLIAFLYSGGPAPVCGNID